MKKAINFFIFAMAMMAVNFSANAQDCQGFRTQTQGGWGMNCNGSNSGCYRNDNFSPAFPDGLTIGCAGGNTLTLTSALAVKNFLPQNSTSGTLVQNYTDPISSSGGVLCGELVAVKLNIGFDNYDQNFGSNPIHLGDLIIKDGPYMGLSVNQFSAKADSVMSNLLIVPSITDITNTADSINYNYDNGITDNGFLLCPSIPTGLESSVIKNSILSCSPNPFSGAATVEVLIGYDSEVTIEIYDISGSMVKKIFSGPVSANEKKTFDIDGRKLSEGIYFCRLSSSKESLVKKLVLVK